MTLKHLLYGDEARKRIHRGINAGRRRQGRPRHAILDADDNEALAGGARFWVLRQDRERAPAPGRYLVVVDSGASERPAWSLLPAALVPPARRR